MQTQTDCATLNDNIASNPLEQCQINQLNTLADELKLLLVGHNAILKEEGVRKEVQKLEQWLETERDGPAPAGIISASGISWLSGLRDRLKLSHEEALRLESEGGNPSSKEQLEHTENLLKTIRRIDEIINDSTVK